MRHDDLNQVKQKSSIVLIATSVVVVIETLILFIPHNNKGKHYQHFIRKREVPKVKKCIEGRTSDLGLLHAKIPP